MELIYGITFVLSNINKFSSVFLAKALQSQHIRPRNKFSYRFLMLIQTTKNLDIKCCSIRNFEKQDINIFKKNI